MLVQLFVLLSSFGLSYAVSCNSLTVEGGDGGGVYPSGVCVNWGSASQKYECPGEMMQYFTTLDCTGASQSVDPCAESPPPCSATATCNAAPCSYALMEVWQGVTECDDDDAPVNEDTIYMNLPQLVGANEECVNGDEGTSAKLSCSNDGYTQTMYSTSDCSGSVVQSNRDMDMCYVQQGYGMATKYTCNLVAPGAEETPLPTPYPTYGEIIVVTDNNDPGPQPTPRPTYPTPRPTAPTPEPTPSTKPPTTATPTTGAPTEVPTTGAPTEATDNPTTAQPTPVTQDPTTAEPTTAGPTAAPQQSSRDQPGGAYAIQAANYIAFFVFAINLMMA